MANNKLDIDYKKLNIDDCFKSHYSVPDYQREYVWGNAQIEQLLADIEEAYFGNPDKPYFMGMTVVYRGDSNLELIDGQQRITTFFICLCSLISIYKENNKPCDIYSARIYSPVMMQDGSIKDAFGLELQYSDSDECLKNIFHGTLPNELEQEKLSESDQRLYDAYVTIKKRLTNDFSNIEDLMKFAFYLFNNVQFVQIEARDISDALKIFETINQRGVGLNSMDLLKNMIFMQVSRDCFGELNSSWKTIIDKIASIDEKPLRFLRYFITATYDIADSTGTIKGILAEDKIYKWLMDNDSQCNYKKKPFEFVGTLTDGINRYINFMRPNKSDAGNEYLENIGRIAGTSYKSHLVLLLAAVNMDENTLAHFKQVLEAIIYYSTVNRVKGNETEKIFANWCPKIRNIKTTEDLKKFVGAEIIPQVDKWKTDKIHHTNFMSLNIKTTQLYRIRFILSRITKYVDDIRGGGKNYGDVSKCYDTQYQIEHIMPQKCKKPLDYGVKAEEFTFVVNSLGNLTLLEKTFNAACQNATYEAKCKIYPNSCFYLTTSLPGLEDVGKNTVANSMNGKLQAWTTWNKDSISARHEMLYELSEEIWDISSFLNQW